MQMQALKGEYYQHFMVNTGLSIIMQSIIFYFEKYTL